MHEALVAENTSRRAFLTEATSVCEAEPMAIIHDDAECDYEGAFISSIALYDMIERVHRLRAENNIANLGNIIRPCQVRIS